MSAVFSNVNMSLDGYIAPDGLDLEHAAEPTYKDWQSRWMQLQGWMFQQQFFAPTCRWATAG